MNKGLLIIMSGPSGVGKGSIRERIINDPELNLVYSISMTTRAPRGLEKNGVDYFFVDEETFRQKVEHNEFLEYAKFVDNYYGTPRAYVEEIRAQGKNVFIEIEVNGAKQIMDKYRANDVFSIFVLPPSTAELEQRIRGRKTDSEEKIARRLERALQEISRQNEYDYRVINDDLNRCANEIKAIILERIKLNKHA